jgi:hypothetical protein
MKTLLTKIISYVEITLLVFGAIAALISVSLPTLFIEYLTQDQDGWKVEEMRAELGLFTAVVAGAAAIAILLWLIVVAALYKGVQERSTALLTTWLIVNTLISAILLFTLLTLLVKNPVILPHIPLILFLIYRLWSLFVIHSFVNEIRYCVQMARQPIYQPGQGQAVYQQAF